MSDTSNVTAQTSPLNALGRIIFWSSLIIAAIAVYYFFLIERGSEHVYHRNFRSLTQIERQINSGFDRFTQVASTRAVADQKITEQQIGGHTYRLELKNDSDGGECKLLNSPEFSSDALFKISALRGNAIMEFCIKTSKDDDYVFVQKVSLSDFINASVALEQFHQVMVFDGDRNLIYRSGEDSADLIKTNAYDLLDQNITSHEAVVALPDGWLRDDNGKKSGKPIKTNNADSADDNSSAKLIPFSQVRKFTIGEEKYLAFVRPIKLNYATTAQPDMTPTWYVVGITTESEFNASRFVIPRWWVAIFILAFALFILSTPYIKLRLLGPRDLIRSSTISLTVVATLFAATITTVMLLNLSSYLLAENNIHAKLRELSQLLANEFTQELDTKKNLLEKLATNEPGIAKSQLLRASVFDADGNLRAIWSEKDTIKTSGFSAKNRNFWQQLMQGDSAPAANPDQPYSLDNILSRIDGRKLTVCAIRIPQPFADISQKRGWTTVETTAKGGGDSPENKAFSVIAGLFTFDVFANALLPKGYGFIVIDNSSGTVQYHSEAGADLIEHLYEETDNNPALKTAVNTRSPDTFLTNYRGYRYLFHTRPLAYSQWTLVTYFSQEFLDRVNLGLLISATGLSVGFLLLYLCAGLLGFKCLSNSKINLLWPDAGQTENYRQLAILLSVFALSIVAAIACLHADRLFSVIALTPLAALCGAYICLVNNYQPLRMTTSVSGTTLQSPLSSRETVHRELLQRCVSLIIATVLIACASLWANDEWPWQLLPSDTHWRLKFLAHGSGVFIALALMVIAYAVLWRGLRNRAANHRNMAVDWRRALLNLVFLTSSVIVIGNSRWWMGSVVAIALFFTFTQPLWNFGSNADNRLRCKFYLPIDRRSDRGQAYALHRACITLMIAILVILPALAFYRDATSLYVLRWSQQDAQKLRSQIEGLLRNGNVIAPSDRCDFKCRFDHIVGENERFGLLSSFSVDNHGRAALGAAPQITWQSQRAPLDKNDDAEARLMRPIAELSHSLARIAGFSKVENDTDDDADFGTWRVASRDGGQQLFGNIKFGSDKWLELHWSDYSDFGFLNQYRLWILLGLASFCAVVIYPMIRLILRELVAEADLRPYPALGATELDLVLRNQRNTLLLVSGNSLDKAAAPIADIENDVVEMLKTQRVRPALESHAPSIATLPYEAGANDVAPEIMVVAEQRWQTMASSALLRGSVKTHANDSNSITWEALLEGINKLRYPDDLPDLALDHWQLDRTCTLLICRNNEAQTTLAAYATQFGWQPQTLGNKINGDKIWLHNIEEIIFEPSLRKQLLSLLENLRTHEASRSIILTSLVLPHLWFSEKNGRHDDGLNARELARWMAALARVNVRAVNALTVEQQMCEINRSYHALPRPSREAEYALWWQYSTPDERAALAALAHEGLINPYNRAVIRSLMARGLIFRGSILRFCDKAFRLFVQQKYPVTQLRRQADIELQQSSWGAARGPLLITLAILGYGVMVMGGGAFETILGLATSIGASIPALLNLTRLIKREPNAT